MSKLAVKYLDPETGEYKYATVIDVGDLTKLKTTVKSDLVSAINSIEITGDVPADVQNQLDEINKKIKDIQNSGLTDKQLAEIDKSISDGVGDLAGKLKDLEDKVSEDNAKFQAEISEDINKKLSNVESDYNAKVNEVSESLDGAKTDISNVASDLSNTKNRLQKTETNYVEMSTEIDGIHGELSSKVDSSEFDLMQSKVTDNTTAIKQTREDISLLATKTSLDLVTDRVSKAESDIQLNADGLTSRVTYTELNKQLENVSKFGDNLVRGTRDWDGWKTDDILKAYISNDTYRHCKIQVIEDKQYAYYTTFEDMEIGKTYTVSIYFKVKNKSDYVSVNFLEGKNSYALTDIKEDTTSINGWKRVSASFVPAEKTFVGSFKLSFLETNNIGYLVAPKIEIGGKASDWRPHFDDDNEVIVKNQTLIKQNSDSIATLVSTTKKQGEDISQAETKITQTSESVLAQAKKIQEIEGEVSENKASIEVANEKIELKVSQTDIDKSISDITLDTKNRIVNSDFSFGFSNWNERNEKFVLKDIEGVKYASITRTGLTSVSTASIASDKFPVSNKEKLTISADIIIDSVKDLDDKTIMSLELFDISDIRIFSKSFNLSDITKEDIKDKVKFRSNTSFKVDRQDVAKARLKIQLNKNGSINFSKISLQKGTLNDLEWIAAPEDERLYRVETQTSIEQNAKEIVLKASQADLDVSNKKIDDNTASIKVNAESITSTVAGIKNSLAQNNLVHNSVLNTSDGWVFYPGFSQTNSITSEGNGCIEFKSGSNDTWTVARSKKTPISSSKTYSTRVSILAKDDIPITGMKFGIAIEGFNSNGDRIETVEGIAGSDYPSVPTNDWENVMIENYTFKDQDVTHVAFAIWTNGTGHYYCAKPILVNSSVVGDYVPDGVDKSQITQMSDQISTKVSNGEVISSINQEAGQILLEADKLVLNAKTTKINGNAFIGGNMIIDGSIEADKLKVKSLEALNANIGVISNTVENNNVVTETAILYDRFLITRKDYNNLFNDDENHPLQSTTFFDRNGMFISKEGKFRYTEFDGSETDSLYTNTTMLTSEGLILNDDVNTKWNEYEEVMGVPPYTAVYGKEKIELTRGKNTYSIKIDGGGGLLFDRSFGVNNKVSFNVDVNFNKKISVGDINSSGALKINDISAKKIETESLKVNGDVEVKGNITSLTEHHKTIAIGWNIQMNLTRIGNIVIGNVYRQTVNIPSAFENSAMNEKIPNGYKPAQSHSFTVNKNNGSNGAFPGIWMLSANGNINFTNSNAGNYIWQGSTVWYTNDSFV